MAGRRGHCRCRSGPDIRLVLVSLGAATTAALLLAWVQTATSVGKCLATGLAVRSELLAFVTGAPVLMQALSPGWLLPFIPALLTTPLVISAFVWIDAPTIEGRGVLDRIAGFRRYLFRHYRA